MTDLKEELLSALTAAETLAPVSDALREKLEKVAFLEKDADRLRRDNLAQRNRIDVLQRDVKNSEVLRHKLQAKETELDRRQAVLEARESHVVTRIADVMELARIAFRSPTLKTRSEVPVVAPHGQYGPASVMTQQATSTQEEE